MKYCSLIMVLLLSAFGVSPAMVSYAQTPKILLDGELVRDNGEAYDITQLSGKIRLINFWATWCVPCVHEMPTLVALARAYADHPFEVILVNQNFGGYTKGRDFLIKYGWDQGVTRLYDQNGSWMRLMRLKALPSTFVVDAQNRLIELVVGDRDWMADDFRQRLDNWLKEVP